MKFNSKKEIVTNTFDEASHKFDKIGTPFFKHYGEVMVGFSGIKPDDCILDIACGTGTVTFPVAAQLSEKGSIHGVDISSKMVEQCKLQMDHAKHRNVRFSVMDAEHLEFDDCTFDKVLCSFGLFFLTDIEQGLREIKRVLKPGGQLVFSSWNREYQLKWLTEILAKYIPALAKSKTVFEDKIDESDFTSIEGIGKILRISGFQKQQIIVENIDCYYDSEEEWIESRWHNGFRMYFNQLSEKDFGQVKEEIYENLQVYKENGQVKITQSAFITKATV
jgi:ubiquinone/menaquinone biosynthesis C-methylase UbiE